MPQRILGISAYYHDSAAALLVDGRPVAAAQEERFTRRKHDAGFPAAAIAYCLAEGGVGPGDVDYVVFYDKPFLKFERLLETYLAFAPRGFASFKAAAPIWAREKLFQKDLLVKELRRLDAGFDPDRKLRFSEHHLSHAASAFYPSPFREALVLTMDGVGEWATTSAAVGKDNRLDIVKELHFPHSLGLLYSAFTYYLGFKVNSGEYKMMGLAPYGEPLYASRIADHLIDVKADGTFRLNQEYFSYCTGLTMTGAPFAALFGQPVRKADAPLTQFHMDVAASIQAVTEDVVLRMARSLQAETGLRNLCLAGGVALNCVANGKLVREGRFENVWVQPASGDAGGALGAALAFAHIGLTEPRNVSERKDGMGGGYLGPAYSDAEVTDRLTRIGAVTSTLDEDALIDAAAGSLAAGDAVGWFQGRMEFGPRALGARSILGDARSPTMQKNLNLKIKFRESFRPFAPSVLRDDVAEWFDLDVDSPYMLIVAGVNEAHRLGATTQEQGLFGIDKLAIPRSDIPAVTHVDYSARLQTVGADGGNPRYYKLLTRFKEKTGCPVLANTSFNVRGEPIVCTPEDAFRCFMGTNLDALAIGGCFLEKKQQNPALLDDYRNRFDPD